MPKPPPPQLSLFDDSQVVMLRNDAAVAVLADDPGATAAARDALARHCPGDELLPALSLLQAALAQPRPAPFSTPDEAEAARLALVQQLAPAARAVLAADAAGWLQARWSSLARRAAALPFDSDRPAAHAAALWLQAGQAVAAAEAVVGIGAWRRQPQPLGWMLQATHAQTGLDAAWPLLAELAWMSPATLARLLPGLADPLLARLLRGFDAQFEPEADDPQDPLAWFPAWLLIEKPALLARLREAQPGSASAAERGFRLVASLLGLESQGRQAELPAERKRLRGLQPSLYAAYLRRR